MLTIFWKTVDSNNRFKFGRFMTRYSPKILIVEDSSDTRLLFQKILQRENFQVFQAACGQDALYILDEGLRPDVIILDYSMPDMDGVTFIQKLREYPGRSKIKVTLVSGWDDLKAKAGKLGADSYIRKPIELAIFKQEIKRLVSN